MAVQALGAGRLEVAVGGQGADARQAHLAAVGVAGEDRVVPVGGELVQHPEVRRVRDAEPQVGVRVGRPGDLVEPVVAQVRVVDAGEGDPQPAHLERAAGVGEVEPARRGRAPRAGRARAARGVSVCRLPSSGSR